MKSGAMSKYLRTLEKVAAPLPVTPLPGPEGAWPEEVKADMVTLVTPTAFEVEPYRMLGCLVLQMHQDAGLHILAISSPGVGDGKTSIAINLAAVLAQKPEARVLLVEADLRRPSILTYLGLRDVSGEGLVRAVLEPGHTLEKVVHACLPFNFDILPVRHSVPSPYAVLKLPRFRELLQEARQHYDYVVVDAPPLLPFADCRLIEPWMDGFLVVVAAHKTSPKQLTEALYVMDPAKLVGLVFNKDNHLAPHYDDTYRYYAQSPNGHHKGWRPFRRRRQA
jgi:Mrp family chromosome partitioning ATPase